MKYLAITQKTASWLLNNNQYLSSIRQGLPSIFKNESLSEGMISIGPLRICADKGILLCIWNVEYLSSSGVEDWGFVSLDEKLWQGAIEIWEDVFERYLFVMNQRLQGLLFPDDRLIHRNLGDNIHSCLAGRGDKARRYSIGYKEGTILENNVEMKIFICSPPWSGNIEALKRIVHKESEKPIRLLTNANSILIESNKRPLFDGAVFSDLRGKFIQENLNIEKQKSPIAEIPKLGGIVSNAVDNAHQIPKDYDKWISANGGLTDVQRRILETDVLLKQPLRLIGAAGSGKTLLMQLLVIRRLKCAEIEERNIRILYVTHNSEMAMTIKTRFYELGAEKYIQENSKQELIISTLYEYCQNQIGISQNAIIDKDAYQTKMYQKSEVVNCIKRVITENSDGVLKSKIFSKLGENDTLLLTLAELITSEIGMVIKGCGFSNDRKRYIESQKPLSMLHKELSIEDRNLVYDVYELYHKSIFEMYEVLDSDDVALTLLSSLRTPLWEMKRKKMGFDFLFVDETQLFNENERMLFHLLTKSERGYTPIALAIDQAQDLRGAISSGFGRLGIENISNETLLTVHRCTKEILNMAFYIIQRSVDLFSTEFPDFTSKTVTLVDPEDKRARYPRIIIQKDQPTPLAKTIIKEVRKYRKDDYRKIAIIVHAEKYWEEIEEYFRNEKELFPYIVATKRGENIDLNKPVIVLTRPDLVGGQEYDAVIVIGLEKGLVPPITNHSDELAATLEQQAYREIYLSFTRARYALLIINRYNSTPTAIIRQCIEEQLIIYD